MYVTTDEPGSRTIVLREREEDEETGRREVTVEHRLEFNGDGVARVTKETGRYAIEHILRVREAERSEPADQDEED